MNIFFIKYYSIKLLLIFFSLIVFNPRVYGQKRVINPHDFLSLRRIKDFTVSSENRMAAYTIEYFNLDSDLLVSDIYMVNIEGGFPHRLTTHPACDNKPCWSPDGNMLGFISSRSGLDQIHIIPMSGGEGRKLSDAAANVKKFKWSPDGKKIAIINQKTEKGCFKSGMSHIADIRKPEDSFFYGCEEEVGELVIVSLTGGGAIKISEDSGLDLIIKDTDLSFSPDGEKIVFTGRKSSENQSRDGDIYVADLTAAEINRITDKKTVDRLPVYSPDGNYIIYLSAGIEDGNIYQYDVILYDCRTDSALNMTNDFDLNVNEIVWDWSSEWIYFTADDQGRNVIFSLNIADSEINGLVFDGCNSDIKISQGSDLILFKKSRINMPSEIYRCNLNGREQTRITFTNQILLDSLVMSSLKEFRFKGYKGTEVHGFILLPPFFDLHHSYPCIFLLRNGLHNMLQDKFSFTWNEQILAASGYVVVMINIRGARGYGLQFSKEMSGDWGGAPYEDFIRGVDYVLDEYSFIDQARLTAAGESFGGYMVNWIAGHTGRFRCLISDNGISELFSFFGTTDRPLLIEKELGANPYTNPEVYDNFTPLRYADNFNSPVLIMHNLNNTYSHKGQSIQMYNSLKYKGVPTRMIFFRNEGKMLKRPDNIRKWWKEVLEWIRKWNE